MTVQAMTAPQVRPADVAALRDHPGFHGAVEGYCAASLARYRALSPIERWLLKDTGGSSISGVATVLGALGALTRRALLKSQPVTTGVVSRGRVRLYVERALANGLFAPACPGATCSLDTPLVPDPRFYAVMTGVLAIALDALGELAPEVRSARARLANPAFAAELSIIIGLLAKTHADLFPQGGMAQVFQGRDGGTRLMEALILGQPPGRERLLETCHVSRTALAAAAFCSRVHVNRLLADGEAKGLLTLRGDTLEIAPAFSDAGAAYFAGLFAVTRAGAMAILGRA